MAYTKTNWVDGPANGPSINATNLNKVESGIHDLDGRLATAATDAQQARSLANAALPRTEAATTYLTKAEATNLYALKTAIDQVVPIGSVMPWFSSSVPTGWIELNGQSVSRTGFPRLFSLLGTTFGGDAQTFKVPDVRGRALFGRNGNGVGAIGALGGAATHTLTVNEMPSHTHPITDGLSRFPSLYATNAGGGTQWELASWATQFDNTKSFRVNATGGGKPHNNMPPFLSCMYVIRAA